MDLILDLESKTNKLVKKMDYKVDLKELEAKPIVSISEEVRNLKIPFVFPKLMKEIFAFLEKAEIKPIGAPLAIFTDWKRGKGKIKVGIPVDEKINSNVRISASQTPTGKFAYTLYIGKLRKINSVYKTMKDWIKINGYTYTNLWMEVYRTDPNNEPDQNKWETEVYLLLE